MDREAWLQGETNKVSKGADDGFKNELKVTTWE